MATPSSCEHRLLQGLTCPCSTRTATPSSYLTERAFFPTSDYAVTQSTSINNFDLIWQPCSPYLDPVYVQQPLSLWYDFGYGTSSPLLMDNLTPSSTSGLIPWTSQPANLCVSRQFPAAMPEDISGTGYASTITESESKHSDDEDSEDEDSESDDMHCAASVGPTHQTPARPFHCTCGRSFARPEHFRRHAQTVHNGDRNYECKVPSCRKAFTRTDNLRDHYWTHLRKEGGRQGINLKLSLDELKVILGSKERDLVSRLRAKLRKHTTKQRAKYST